jgi:hypothetical protein
MYDAAPTSAIGGCSNVTCGASCLPAHFPTTVNQALIESNIFEPGTDMKYILILSILALLGGCAIVPAGYGDHRDGYYRERDYNRGDRNYRERYYNQGDGNYRDYSYRGG